MALTGDARYSWMHGIGRRSSERREDGTWRLRRRRVSVTFRTVVNQ